MTSIRCEGLLAQDPLGFLAAVGLLRVVDRYQPGSTLHWQTGGQPFADLTMMDGGDVVDVIVDDLERWRAGHLATDFAEGGSRKVQDLKHPPEDFRALMRSVMADREAASFVASYATGVAVDGTGQTKPTGLHFTAGRQRFMDAVLSVRNEATRNDFVEALVGPWRGREGPKNPRWRAASERSRALLAYDPGKDDPTTIVGAVWLAFQAMPLFPSVPVGARVRTTGFTGRGHNEQFSWPVWSRPFTLDEVAVALGTENLAEMSVDDRRARGIDRVFQARVVRSSQGYGNFAAATPV